MDPIDNIPKVPEDPTSREEIFTDPRERKRQTEIASKNKRASDICDRILSEASASNKAELKETYDTHCSSILRFATTPATLVEKIKAAKAKLDSISTESIPVSPPSPKDKSILKIPADDFKLRQARDLVATIKSSANSSNVVLLKEDLDDVCYTLLGCTDIPPTLTQDLRDAHQRLKAFATGTPVPAPTLPTKVTTTGVTPQPSVSRAPPPLLSTIQSPYEKALKICKKISDEVNASNIQDYREAFNKDCLPLLTATNLPDRVRTEIKSIDALLKMVESNLGIL